MQDKEQKIGLKLPVRIAGLVFWGLVFIGLFFAVIILQQERTYLVEKNNKETLVLAYEIEEIFEQYSQPPVLENAAGRIREKLNERMNVYGFHAARLYENKETLSVGDIGQADNIYEFTLHYYASGSNILQTVRMEIYYPNVKNVIADVRKQVLLSTGIGIIIFGLFLQRILQKMLSSPFQKMIDTAEKFSQGNEDARFDEKRMDEFGYLGKFINNAIESILSSKAEVIHALERASISERDLSLEKERADVTLYSITDSVITVDVDERIVYLNLAGERLLACSIKSVKGKKFNDVINVIEEISGNSVKDSLRKCFVTGGVVNFPEHSSLILKDGSIISIEASVAPMKSNRGDLMGAVIVIQDVSHARRLTRQLSYQASHDLLTGLYNRRKFEEYLQEILMNVREENRYHALFYIDLDNFKIVNDTCGHVAGDELLKQLPAIFNEILRSGDIVARLGGDEFGIILENCGLKQAASIADKIRQSIKDYRFVWDDKIFEIGVSIGVTAITADNVEMSHVLSSADVACYAAKDSGRNRVHIYEPSDKIVSERYGLMHWTARIKKALEDNRFRLYQQSIVGIKNKKEKHLEILLRMIDEDDNIIPPDAFIPSAERYGLMTKIDRWVIREAFQYISKNKRVNSKKNANCIFSINLSGDSINDGDLLEYILKQKEEFDISLANICFEVTETVAISNLSKATILIAKLKSYGCKFSLDDFGSGLSSFSYLKNLPVNYLKIDGSFVRNISLDIIDRTMVEAIQQVGKVMGLKTVAEHVENEEILKVLEEIGVDYAQGHYLGKPEPIPES